MVILKFYQCVEYFEEPIKGVRQVNPRLLLAKLKGWSNVFQNGVRAPSDLGVGGDLLAPQKIHIPKCASVEIGTQDANAVKLHEKRKPSLFPHLKKLL